MLPDDHAAEQVINAKELAAAVMKCFRDVEHRHHMGEAGRRVLTDTRSAFGKLMKS
jgi:3-deoxy-D-manno-octulosonic-acid transferase